MQAMKLRKVLVWVSLGLCIAVVALQAARAQNQAAQAPPKYSMLRYEWLKKPWTVRYVIEVYLRPNSLIKYAKKENAKSEAKHSPEFRDYQEYVAPVLPFQGQPYANQDDPGFNNTYGDFGLFVLQFDRTGQLISPHIAPMPLMAKQILDTENRRNVQLYEGGGQPGSNWYYLGEWWDYLPGPLGESVTPALCSAHDDGRYGLGSGYRAFNPDKKFSVQEVLDSQGIFGCREWTYQLKRPVSVAGLGGQVPDAQGLCAGGFEPGMYKGRLVCPGLDESSHYKPNAKGFVQPYIDVTSYHDKVGKKGTIGHFIGWAGFDDPVRPVIGKFGDRWVCLHECPDGAAPGPIEDIAQWTTRRGWPLPKPGPYFVDSKFKASKEDLEE
ncbi:hypothetical protein [Rhodoferax aquaticus]|uniref:DUF239 domain-containing protein n=1 Tax=Rhodoferax aquaticus TaxID=2527691 RepID=A0A515EJB6_9BURK|nr:hypothetical protein [Rhodoferax aquaticus]QDL52742.1 hypothetical protein EXZ61_00325 [Rhodoferax aquaticus]